MIGPDRGAGLGTGPARARSTPSRRRRCSITLAPGQNGTKKLLARYGDRLVCVRHRYDAARALRHKTVELIVDTQPWTPRTREPRRRPDDLVGVRIAYSDTSLRAQIKSTGGIWRPRQRLWEIDWKTVRALGLEARVVSDGRG